MEITPRPMRKEAPSQPTSDTSNQKEFLAFAGVHKKNQRKSFKEYCKSLLKRRLPLKREEYVSLVDCCHCSCNISG